MSIPGPPSLNLNGLKPGPPGPPSLNLNGLKPGPPGPPSLNLNGLKPGPPGPPGLNLNGLKPGPPGPPGLNLNAMNKSMPPSIGLIGLPGAKVINKLDILPAGVKEKKKYIPSIPMKSVILTVVRPAEIINSIWMKVDESSVKIDRSMLEKEL